LLGAELAFDNRAFFVIACNKREAFVQGSEATKQSILALPPDGSLRAACHRARIRATRWLAMTAKIIPRQLERRLAWR
jgi:hypothetical protein